MTDPPYPVHGAEGFDSGHQIAKPQRVMNAIHQRKAYAYAVNDALLTL